MGGKRSKKKQVQVRSATTRSAPRSLPPPSQAEDLTEISSMDPTASPEVEDHSSPVSMKGGCGKVCRHLDRGVNIDRLSVQFGKSKCTLSLCQDCIKDSKATSGKKGKAKSAKKKLMQNSPSNISKKWICLACGHVGCGSIVNKSTVEQNDASNEEVGQDDEAPTGHAWKHSLIAKHPLALQSGDKLICWCFMCNMAVDFYLPTDREAEDIRQLGNAPLQEAMKLVREKLMKETGTLKAGGRGVSVVEDSKPVEVVSLDGVSLESPIAQANSNTHSLLPKRSREVKGLINLGNTCFFNSVMQNLLALDMLRDYFTQDSQAVEGPLTSSLRRLFLETNSDCSSSKASTDSIGYESGLKKGVKGRLCWESSVAYNPRSLFGAICAKAPRFRGFQQQDSHELLRCLLEGLNSEEQSTKPVDADNRKSVKSSGSIEASEVDDSGFPKDSGKPIAPTQSSTLVDKYFGGQLSSTVCCCECGYSSVVYEPILDLSLQIPTRQLAKKNQAKANQRSSSSSGGRLQKVSSPREMKPTKAAEKVDLTKSPLLSRPAASETKVVSLQILSSVQKAESRFFTEEGGSSTKFRSGVDTSSADFGWLDFVGGGTQLAEGTLQGFEDNSSTMQSSSSMVAHTVESLQENDNHVQPLTEIGYLQPLQNTEGAGETVGILPHNTSDSTENDPAVDNLNEESSVNLAVSTEDVSQSEQDGPLPLAAGTLLLPYEPLQLPSKYKGEEQKLCIEAGKCENEATSSLQSQEKDVPGSVVKQDDAGLDGFAQLFEEEENFGETEQGMEAKACLKSSQAPEESCVDGSWDADGGAFDGGNVGTGLERLTDLQEAIFPLSLEGCLADFTKAELLSGENAWECESCTKHMKAKILTLTSDNEGKDEVSGTPFEEGDRKEGHLGLNKESCVKGGHSEMKKETCKLHCEDTVVRAEESLSVPSTHGNGALLHEDSSSSITWKQNGTVDQACPVGKELQNGAFSAHMESNRVAQECHATVEVKEYLNCRLANGSARLNELDSGQVCGNQSLLKPTDLENGCVDQKASSILVVNNPQKNSSYMDRQNDVLSVGLLKQDDAPKMDEMSNGTCMTSSIKKDAQSNLNLSGNKSSGAFLSMPKDKAASTLKTSNKQLFQGKNMKRKSQLGHQQAVKRDATKRLLISKAPPILTVHLKRFAQDMRGRLNKLSGHVTFPEMLDLRPFLDPKYLDLESCIYRLVGVVEHGGTMRGGHYVAYVRGPALEGENIDLDRDCWYYISDSSVHKSSLQAVLNSEAYLLFYEKCKFD